MLFPLYNKKYTRMLLLLVSCGALLTLIEENRSGYAGKLPMQCSPFGATTQALRYRKLETRPLNCVVWIFMVHPQNYAELAGDWSNQTNSSQTQINCQLFHVVEPTPCNIQIWRCCAWQKLQCQQLTSPDNALQRCAKGSPPCESECAKEASAGSLWVCILVCFVAFSCTVLGTPNSCFLAWFRLYFWRGTAPTRTKLCHCWDISFQQKRQISWIACARFQARQEALKSQCEEVSLGTFLRPVNAILRIQGHTGSPRAWI